MQTAASISTRVVVGLGANIGDRLANLRQAQKRLASEARVLATSQVYETPPAGGPPQPDYLNAAVLLETTASLPSFLGRCLALERGMGRVRPDPVRNGPRPIDLDLLWAQTGDGQVLTLAVEGLTLPHPRLAERPFALRPLLDVAPDAAAPDGTPYAALSAAQAAIASLGPL